MHSCIGFFFPPLVSNFLTILANLEWAAEDRCQSNRRSPSGRIQGMGIRHMVASRPMGIRHMVASKPMGIRHMVAHNMDKHNSMRVRPDKAMVVGDPHQVTAVVTAVVPHQVTVVVPLPVMAVSKVTVDLLRLITVSANLHFCATVFCNTPSRDGVNR